MKVSLNGQELVNTDKKTKEDVSVFFDDLLQSSQLKFSSDFILLLACRGGENFQIKLRDSSDCDIFRQSLDKAILDLPVISYSIGDNFKAAPKVKIKLDCTFCTLSSEEIAAKIYGYKH